MNPVRNVHKSRNKFQWIHCRFIRKKIPLHITEKEFLTSFKII